MASVVDEASESHMAVRKPQRRGLLHERAGGPTEWYTPASIFKALDIEFDLDPCSPGSLVVPWVPARNHYTKVEDGLTQPWFGRVWLNPPYGVGMDRWLHRFVAHGNGIALVFARTDTLWFHTYATRADALCFTRGRIAFVLPVMRRNTGNAAGSGSVLMAHGKPCVESLRQSGLGWIVDLRAEQSAGRRFLQAGAAPRRDPLQTVLRGGLRHETR